MLGGECKIFEAPQTVVLGKTQPDQDWIDGNVEAGVGGCGWARPKPRPAEASVRSKPTAATAKKPGLFNRAKARVKAVAAPRAAAAPAPPAAPKPMAAWPDPVPPATKDPIDELLNPTPR